jgi:hypothetical protein
MSTYKLPQTLEDLYQKYMEGNILNLCCAGEDPLPGGDGRLAFLQGTGITGLCLNYQNNLKPEDYMHVPSSLEELSMDHTQATDEDLAIIAERCSQLRELSMKGADVTDEGLADAAPDLQALVSINMDDVKNVKVIGLRALATSCKNLQDVTCGEGTTVDGVRELLSSDSIKHIDLMDARDASEGLKALVDNDSVVIPKHIKVVWYVDYEGCNGCFGCDRCLP